MNAGTGFGTVVLEGRTFQIVDLRLEGAAIVVVFHVDGPTPQLGGRATVFGEDGSGCWQTSPLTLIPVPAGEIAHAKITLRVGQVVEDAASLPA